MLPSPHRLRKTKDFQGVFAQGRGVREDGLFFKTRATKTATTRLGIVVSKKVAKKAVDRNRIRRVLTEAIRHQIDEVKQGLDGVIVVLPGFQERDTGPTLQRLFKKAAILK